MDIEISSLMTVGSDSSWSVTKTNETKLTHLKEDRIAYELTEEEGRKQLSTQL